MEGTSVVLPSLAAPHQPDMHGRVQSGVLVGRARAVVRGVLLLVRTSHDGRMSGSTAASIDEPFMGSQRGWYP